MECQARSENKADASKTEASEEKFCSLNTNFIHRIFLDYSYEYLAGKEKKHLIEKSQEDVNREYVCAHKMQSLNSGVELFFSIVPTSWCGRLKWKRQQKIFFPKFQTIFSSFLSLNKHSCSSDPRDLTFYFISSLFFFFCLREKNFLFLLCSWKSDWIHAYNHKMINFIVFISINCIVTCLAIEANSFLKEKIFNFSFFNFFSSGQIILKAFKIISD